MQFLEVRNKILFQSNPDHPISWSHETCFYCVFLLFSTILNMLNSRKFFQIPKLILLIHEPLNHKKRKFESLFFLLQTSILIHHRMNYEIIDFICIKHYIYAVWHQFYIIFFSLKIFLIYVMFYWHYTPLL